MAEQQGRRDADRDDSDNQNMAQDPSNKEQGSAQEGAGITNRPIEREQQEQQNVPPRGESKDGAHA